MKDEREVILTAAWYGSTLEETMHAGALALGSLLGAGSPLAPHRGIESPARRRQHDPIGIRNWADYAGALEAVHARLLSTSPAAVLHAGGGCALDVAVYAYLRQKYQNLRVLWFDAHADCNTPETSGSGYIHGMAARWILEPAAFPRLGFDVEPLPPERLSIIGSRAFDPAELSFLQDRHVTVISSSEFEDRFVPLERRIVADGSPFFVHIDMDVVDPADLTNRKVPAHPGIHLATLLDFVRALYDERRLPGISLLENTELDTRRLSALRTLV